MPKPKMTAEEIEVRIWAFVVVAITVILFGIVVALLYSVTFVVQPIKAMAPIDQAYTKMLNDIVLLIVGGIGGIVGKRAVYSMSTSMRSPPCPPNGSPMYMQPPQTSTWTPPNNTAPAWSKPPTSQTGPVVHDEDDDDERARMAEARAMSRGT